MLSITIEATELFNELTGEFVTLKPVTLKLEHSLISISKWEAKWHKPFSNSEKTAEEMRDISFWSRLLTMILAIRKFNSK